MKRLLKSTALILSLFVACAPALAQTETADLRLAAEVIGQRYCAVGDKADALELTLRLRYRNAGARKVILYKGNRLFYQVYVLRDASDAAARRYELRTTHARYFDEQPEKVNASSPGSVFVVLPPGATYETKQTVALPVARAGEGRENVSIGAGAHILYLTASTWYESRKLAEELRERWRARGYLWSEPVASDAVSFVVEKERAPVVCQ